MFSVDPFPLWWLREYIYFVLNRTITNCLRLSHETVMCTVCLSVFLWVGNILLYLILWNVCRNYVVLVSVFVEWTLSESETEFGRGDVLLSLICLWEIQMRKGTLSIHICIASSACLDNTIESKSMLSCIILLQRMNCKKYGIIVYTFKWNFTLCINIDYRMGCNYSFMHTFKGNWQNIYEELSFSLPRNK